MRTQALLRTLIPTHLDRGSCLVASTRIPSVFIGGSHGLSRQIAGPDSAQRPAALTNKLWSDAAANASRGLGRGCPPRCARWRGAVGAPREPPVGAQDALSRGHSDPRLAPIRHFRLGERPLVIRQHLDFSAVGKADFPADSRRIAIEDEDSQSFATTGLRLGELGLKIVGSPSGCGHVCSVHDARRTVPTTGSTRIFDDSCA